MLYVSQIDHLFDKELKHIASSNPKIKIETFLSPEVFHGALENKVKQYQKDAIFYISGSKNFIKDMTKDIINYGTKKSQIYHDQFFGY